MEKLHQIKSYIKFLSKASNEHGIHSPFVYDLVTKCFYDKTFYNEYDLLENYKKKILRNQNLLEITDFGEGSKIFKSNQRKVADIAKNAGTSFYRQKLLFRMSKYFRSENILELGTSFGLATAALSVATKNSSVTTVEGCPETAKVAEELFKTFNLENIDLRNQSFEDYFLKTKLKNLDFVFVDGNHNHEKTLEYFHILLNHIHNDSVIIFDDINWSKDMTECWTEIISHPQVSISIDTFKWGIIFFRKEQRKEHFVVRV